MDIKTLATMIVGVDNLRKKHREEETNFRRGNYVDGEWPEEARKEWEVMATTHIVEELKLEEAVLKTAQEILKGA